MAQQLKELLSKILLSQFGIPSTLNPHTRTHTHTHTHLLALQPCLSSPITCNPQEEWKASLKELLGWSGGSERSRLSAQRQDAALQEAMQR